MTATHTTERPVAVGVVGLGHWGPGLARNFAALPGCVLRWLCDADASRLERWHRHFPSARATTDIEELLADDSLDAIAIATPVPTHAPLALRALAAGKHCFVEKPLAHDLASCEQVVAAAAEAQRIVMVGHLLEYHPGVVKLAELVREGQLGALRYLYSQRTNLGKLRSDENVLWSLGPHDVSVVLAIVGEEPCECYAVGESFVRDEIEDVVFCYLRFPSGVAAHLHLSWLDPHKQRRLTVVGAQRMATFDDMELERKVTVYDKGFDQEFESYGEYIARSGDIWSPRVSNEEPLRIECRHFVECIATGRRPRSDEHSGLRVVRVLEALQRSLDSRANAAATAGLPLAEARPTFEIQG